MTNGEQPESVPVTNEVESPADSIKNTALAKAEIAEAEAAAVEAQAAAARARAVRLRRQAERNHEQAADTADTADADFDTDDAAIDVPATGSRVPRRPRLRRPTSKTTAVGAAILLLCASLALTGFFVWSDRVASQKHQRSAEFAAAARQDVMTLLSLNFNKSKEDMEHIADNSTGSFKQHFPVIAAQLTNGLQRSKVVTTASVNDVAVESMTDNSAIVLVAATTQAEAPDGQQQPNGQAQRRTWQIVLTLLRDKGQPKMSNVEFVQ
jgi:Mce-associated membrane protein